MRKHIAIFLIVCACAAVSAAAGAGGKVLGVDDALIALAMQGKELAFQRRYGEAMEVFGRIEREYPDSATGIFGRMAIYQIRMFENEDFRYKAEYAAAEREYEKFALKKLRDGSLPSWELFICGAADGMRGFFRGREGKWFESLTHGLHAVRMFKMLKWQEPELPDTDLGFGMYKYWRSAFTNRLKFLPVFSDQREEGIRLVKSAAANARYSSDLALANLVFIYNFDGRYDEALQTIDALLRKYPQNIIVEYVKGEIFVERKKYGDALKIFEDIYNKAPEVNIALFQQGKLHYRMKDYPKAVGIFEKYLTLQKDDYWRAGAYYWLGLIAEAEGDKRRALENYELCLKLADIKPAKERLKALRQER